MAAVCGGETEATTPVEPSSEGARRRRMEIHKFRFVAADVAVAPPLDNERKRHNNIFPASPPASESCDASENCKKRRKLEGNDVCYVSKACEDEGFVVEGEIRAKVSSEDPTEDPDRPESATCSGTEPDCPKFGMTSVCGRRRDMEDAVAIHPYAAYAGIPVVITSGFAVDNIIKVLHGKRIGTLFHRDANELDPAIDASACEMAVAARECSRRLQALAPQERRNILLDIADALEANEKEILTENEADVDAAQQAGYDPSLVARLALKPGKISSLAKSVRVLAEMDEPIGRILKRTEILDGFILEKTSSPLGVLLIIFESRPDALVQIASLAIRSGNGLLLKGGKEAKRSNAILHKVITSVIPENVGERLIGLITSREEVPELLKLDHVIDLVIPRGSNKLVSQIKASTKIPVLGHADGICHVYVDKSANLDVAKHIVLDAKTDYPAACNAMETLLVHDDLVKKGGLNDLIMELQIKGVTIFGGPKASSLLNIPEANSLHHEYSSLACTVEIVDDVYAAIDHIHQHGSSHTDCIITEDKEVADIFLRQVDSAAVFHNASTRFCDGFRFGLGAEVGISTSRIHARGPVGVEGLLTTRWVGRGSGHVVNGDKGINYTHKELS